MIELILSSLIALALTIILPPLYDGIHRKVRARIQCRIGPSVLQTWYDIVKLVGKEDLVPENASALYLYAPYISYSILLLISIMMPIVFLDTLLSITCDIIIVLYLLSMSSIFIILGGLSSGNVFAFEGARRELSLIIILELIIIFSVVAIVLQYRVLELKELYLRIMNKSINIPTLISSGLLLYCAYVEGFKLPFELPEAEPEIASGIAIEYSGRRLALLKLSIMTKQFLLVVLATNLLCPWNLTNLYLGTLGLILKTLIVFLIFAVMEPLFSRYRLDIAIKSLSIALSLSILSLALSLISLMGV